MNETVTSRYCLGHILLLSNGTNPFKIAIFKLRTFGLYVPGEQYHCMCCDASSEYHFDKITTHIQEMLRFIAWYLVSFSKLQNLVLGQLLSLPF